VQGVTEFLPISSSGHLVFFQSLFGLQESNVLFDVLLHLGTLLAVVVYFRSDIVKMINGATARLTGRPRDAEGERLLLWIVVSTVPTGLMGIIFQDWFESLFSKPRTVGVMLVVTGGVLWLTRYAKQEGMSIFGMGWVDALLIGIAQGVAIIPGISRSGATLSTGLFRGLDQELSGRFAFLLSIPAIFGAAVLEIRKTGISVLMPAYLFGAAAAFFVGLLALKFLMKIIKMGKISCFCYYCWGVGVLMILLLK
jgi:undecaprenyl-diphosphatase